MRPSPVSPFSTIEALGGDELAAILALIAACPGVPAWAAETWTRFLVPAVPNDALLRRAFAVRSSTGQVLGVIAVNLFEDTTELELLAVHPAWRLKGVGRALSEHWLQWAWQGGATQALLEVRVSNTAARRLYEELGFHADGRRPRYYHHPEEDALLMRKDLGL